MRVPVGVATPRHFMGVNETLFFARLTPSPYLRCLFASQGDIQWAEFQLAIPALALLIGVLRYLSLSEGPVLPLSPIGLTLLCASLENVPSSLLGIGGGELMGPLMLYLKVRVG